MKKRVLIYASSGASIRRFAGYFDRRAVDVVAALTAQQVADVISVRQPELIIVVLTNDLIERHTDLLLRLPRACKEFALFNLSSIKSSDLRALYDRQYARYFGALDVLSFLDYLNKKMIDWSGGTTLTPKNRKALLVDDHAASQNSLRALLLSHQFEVESAMTYESAENHLLENTYDLVVTNSNGDELAGKNLIMNGRKGCNKNTSFFYLTLKSASTIAKHMGNFDPKKVIVLPFDLSAINERMKLIH